MLEFPRRYWDKDLHAQLYLIEFLATKWKARTRPKAPPDDATTIRKEIPLLLTMKSERSTRMTDILDQNMSSMFSRIFPRLLMFSGASHPATLEALRVAVQVGRAVVMVWKAEFKRARPPQLSAEIEPVFDVPGHPSYPSGHSTQAHLISRVLTAVHPSGKDSKWSRAVEDFAAVVARNREVAGVHYPTDSAAGVALAKALATILLDRSACPTFATLLDDARAEWNTR